MTTGIKSILILSVLIVIGGLFGVSQYVSYHNDGVRYETNITAGYDNLQQILGQYTLKVAEAAQVPGMMKDDLKDVMTSALSARYGEDGSKAVFQFIKEAYPGQVDASLYTKIQQIIEGGRDKFQNEQTAFIDLKKGYEAELGYVWSGFWLNVAGYPKIDLTKYKTVTSESAKATFANGVDAGIKLR